IPRIESHIVGKLVPRDVPLIDFSCAVLKFLGKVNDILRRQSYTVGGLEVAKLLFNGVTYLRLRGGLGDVGNARGWSQTGRQCHSVTRYDVPVSVLIEIEVNGKVVFPLGVITMFGPSPPGPAATWPRLTSGD